MGISKIFNHKQKALITNAICEAEKNTSGEIRVHIESNCSIDVLDRAANVFHTLQMHKTKLRNGVLFYVSINDHKFAVIGDAGINNKVPANFWDTTKAAVIEMFKDGNIAQGLANGIIMAGQQLKTHFPYNNNDVNELSDEISFGK